MANFFFRTPGAGLTQLKAYGTGVDSPVAPYYFKATIGAGTVRSGGNNTFSLAYNFYLFGSLKKSHELNELTTTYFSLKQYLFREIIVLAIHRFEQINYTN